MNDCQSISDTSFVNDSEFFHEDDIGDMSPQLTEDYHSFDPDISDLWEK